jgi:AraC-like DNA-binding protein
MEKTRKYMDKTRTWLTRLYERLGQEPFPKILYVGPIGSQWTNDPALALQICFMARGEHKAFHVGKLTCELGLHDVGLMNLHFGIRCPPSPGAGAWCLYIDTTNEPLFADLARNPLFFRFPVSRPERLLAAFHTVTSRSRVGTPAHWRYFVHGAGEPTTISAPSDPQNPAFLKAAFYELMAVLLDEAQRADDRLPRTSVAVQDAVDFIAAHYGDPNIGLKDIAAAAHLSQSQVRRLFRREIGDSPKRFLRGMRIAQSRVLLEQTSLRIGEIAAHVGFEDPLFFSRAFRLLSGCSPLAYRQRTMRVPVTGSTP